MRTKPLKIPTVASLKEDMKQNWSRTESGYRDQFGFEIERKGNGQYGLTWKDTFITNVLCLQSAKEISTILINDIIIGT